MATSPSQSLPSQTISPLKKFVISVLLVDEQPIVAETIRSMLQDQPDIVLHYCNDPTKAIQFSSDVQPTVILQDLVMPNVDGIMLIRYFRANPATRDVPMIVLSSKDDPAIKVEAFEAGANDYIVKLPDKMELLARIRYHSDAYIRLLERNVAYKKLEESQKKLYAELADAANYVKSLLPPPIKGEITTSWSFIPSAQLGGDAFGYHWIDQEHFAFYLLDVCGHGVGAALLSISVMNVLRSQTLSNTNFLDPSQVLMSLNSNFQMELHNNMFFTIWYGVYNKTTREIIYASGGHPPAVVIESRQNEPKKVIELRIPGLVIGAMPNAQFRSGSYKIGIHDRLYLFSDGIYELAKSDGTMMQLEEFISEFRKLSDDAVDNIDHLLAFAKSMNRFSTFADDVSILEVTFN